MAFEPLPNGQITPTARPIGAFVTPANPNLAEPARPAPFGTPDGITQLQRGSGGSVEGFNQLEQLAQSLSPFSNTLLKLGEQGAVSYVKGKIEDGYYAQLKELRARSLASLQVQQETGAANTAAAVSELQRVDPPAAKLLTENNPWAAIGRRRALAQTAGAEIDEAVLGELSNNRGRYAGLKPGSPELLKVKADLTAQVLDRYGLSEDDPEVPVYVAPRLNAAWDQFTAEQRSIYRAELSRNTADSTAGGSLVLLSQLIGKDAETIGVPNPFKPGERIRKGEPGYALAAGLALTGEIDRSLAVLAGEDKTKAWEQIKSALGFAAKDPALREIISEIRLGDPNTPLEKRPRWVDANPVEFLQAQNKGLQARNENFEQEQQGIENQLDALYYGPNGPGATGVRVDTPEYQGRAEAIRAEGIRRRYRDIDAYLQKKYGEAQSSATARFSLTAGDQQAIQDWETNLTPDQVSPQNIAATRAEANRIANMAPTAEEQERLRKRLQDAITAKERLVNDMPSGVTGQIRAELRRDTALPAIQALDPKGTAFSLLAPPGTMLNNSGATAPRKLQDFLVGAENLYTRYVQAAFTEYRRANPGVQQINAAQQNVIVSGAIAKARQSAEYKELLDAAKQPAPANGSRPATPPGTTPATPPAAGRPPAGIPQNARGVPIRQARQLPDSTAKAYAARPVLDPQSIYAELQRLQKDKPASRDLYDLATRAGTSTTRYLLEQLKFYPQLDQDGSVKTYLQDRLQRERAANTVSSANFAPASGTNLGMVPVGYNAFSPGSWLMGLITPPAAAATRSSMTPSATTPTAPASLRPFEPVLALLRSGEGGWDSANRGNAGDTPRGIPGLSRMTLGQWKQLQTQGYNALGAYQFVPRTLKLAARELGLSDSTVMTPEVQGRLAVQLMVGSKRPKLADYLNGRSNNLDGALDDLALEWASVRNRDGRSAYAGVGNNAASISRERAAQVLQQARAAFRSGGAGSTVPTGWRPARSIASASGFGAQESFRSNPHEGIDLSFGQGTPLAFSVGGEVLAVYRTNSTARESNGGYGNFMDVRLSTGQIVRLAHLSQIPRGLAAGARFTAGQSLALSGGAAGIAGSGRSSGAHLHMEELTGRMGIEETTRGKLNPARAGGALDYLIYRGGSGPRASAGDDPLSADIASTSDSPYGVELGQIAMGSDGVVSDATQGLFNGADGTVPFDGSAMEQDMGEVAGVQALPWNRMVRQAGRPMTGNAPDRVDQTIERNIRNNNVRDEWSPIDAEWKQRDNAWNPNPRSRPSYPTTPVYTGWLNEFTTKISQRADDAYQASWDSKPDVNMPRDSRRAEYRSVTGDLSDFLSDKEEWLFKQALNDYLDGQAAEKNINRFTMSHLPGLLGWRYKKLANDTLYVWNSKRRELVQQGRVSPGPTPRDNFRQQAFSYLDQMAKDRNGQVVKFTKADLPASVVGGSSTRANNMLYEWNKRREAELESQAFAIWNKAQKAKANAIRNGADRGGSYFANVDQLPGWMREGAVNLGFFMKLANKWNNQERERLLDMLDTRQDTIRPI